MTPVPEWIPEEMLFLAWTHMTLAEWQRERQNTVTPDQVRLEGLPADPVITIAGQPVIALEAPMVDRDALAHVVAWERRRICGVR